MKIGFDYWQVISHYPEQIAYLIDALGLQGESEIHVISAIGKGRIGSISKEVDAALRSDRLEEPLRALKVHEVVFDHPRQSPELKLAKCRELGITMFFDDRDDVCRLLNAHGIMAMRVTRKDNSTYDLGAERSA